MSHAPSPSANGKHEANGAAKRKPGFAMWPNGLSETLTSMGVDSSEGLVYKAIHQNADLAGKAFLRISTIQKRCFGLRRTAIYKARAGLKNKGLLTWKKTVINGRKVTLYQLHPPKVVHQVDSFDPENVRLTDTSQSENVRLTDNFSENVRLTDEIRPFNGPITDQLTDQTNTPPPEGGVCVLSDFQKFFNAYPDGHRGSEDEARRVWTKVKPDPADVMAGLERWKSCDQWHQRGCIQNLENFLRKKLWTATPPGLAPPKPADPRTEKEREAERKAIYDAKVKAATEQEAELKAIRDAKFKAVLEAEAAEKAAAKKRDGS